MCNIKFCRVRVFVSVDFLLIYFFIGKFSQALKQSLSIILSVAQTAKDRVSVNILYKLIVLSLRGEVKYEKWF